MKSPAKSRPCSRTPSALPGASLPGRERMPNLFKQLSAAVGRLLVEVLEVSWAGRSAACCCGLVMVSPLPVKCGDYDDGQIAAMLRWTCSL